MAPVRAVWGFCPSAAVPDTQHPQLLLSPSRPSPSSPAQSCLNAVSADRVKAKDLTEPIRAIVLNDFCESSKYVSMVPYGRLSCPLYSLPYVVLSSVSPLPLSSSQMQASMS